MKSKRTRFISLLLTSISLCFTAGCESDTDQSDSIIQTTGNPIDTTNTKEVLPIENFNGKILKILLRDSESFEFIAETETGETVNDMVYFRNNAVEENYNVQLEFESRPCSWGTESDEFNASLRSSIMSGDESWQLVAGYTAMVTPLVTEKLFSNWMDVESIDLTHDWWMQGINDEMTINNHLYMLTGDIALSTWRYTQCFFFNKEMSADIVSDELYDVVRNGEWTLDYLSELCRDAYSDINGNSIFDEEDRYALMSNKDQDIYAYQVSLGLNFYSEGIDGFPALDIANERAQTALEKLLSIYYNNPASYTFSGQSSTMIDAFVEDRLLFLLNSLNSAEALRETYVEYGILPYPKLDETQESYYSTVSDSYTSLLLPITTTDIELVGTVTEALSAYSREYVIPAFYDIVCLEKVARDNDSREMLDLIRSTLKIDYAFLNSSAIDYAAHTFVNCFRNNSTALQSSWATIKDKAEASFNSILEPYR